MHNAMHDAMQAGTVMLTGADGDDIEAYTAEPMADTPTGGVLVIHHMPGFDEATKEITRRFAAWGYAAICPNLHYREAPGADSDDAAAANRAAGGVPDDRFLGDASASLEYLRGRPASNGTVGCIGFCSGGRQSVLTACQLPVDAAVDCYGAFVVESPPPERAGLMTPIADRLEGISCPMLGLFGNEDSHPSPADVATLGQRLTDLGVDHEFHSYDDAGHAFFAVDRPSYRQHAAVDGWQQIHDFYSRHLGVPGK